MVLVLHSESVALLRVDIVVLNIGLKPIRCGANQNVHFRANGAYGWFFLLVRSNAGVALLRVDVVVLNIGLEARTVRS